MVVARAIARSACRSTVTGFTLPGRPSMAVVRLQQPGLQGFASRAIGDEAKASGERIHFGSRITPLAPITAFGAAARSLRLGLTAGKGPREFSAPPLFTGAGALRVSHSMVVAGTLVGTARPGKSSGAGLALHILLKLMG